MSENARVSIVLPVYNGARFLAGAIRSCRAQTYPHWELIVVDDCSTDDTPQIAAGFAADDARIRVIRHEQNRKLPGALNTGFDAARGDLLTWTSDDNLYRPDALAEMARFLAEHPDVGLVYADYSLIDEEGNVTGTVRAPERRDLMFKSVVGPCFLYRRAVAEAVGPYAEDLYLAEDYDYWLRVSARFPIAALHRDLYLYREHAASLTGQQKPRVLRARETAILRNLPRLGWATRSDRAEAYLHLADLTGAQGRARQRLAYWARALGQQPVLAVRRGVVMLVRDVFGDRWARRLSESYGALKRRLGRGSRA
jgi:glycosyltransferase involved in cell wall biosynthesis